jgi:5-(carboxyamino)imidazole ribonucleotide mutase
MTITDKFRQAVLRNEGCAVILAGSGSDDKPKAGQKSSHIEKIILGLEAFKVPYEVRVASAHKQGAKVESIVREYDALEGALLYVAVAGGVDALSGAASFLSDNLVISCPPEGGQTPREVNTTCLHNPPGSSNVYVKRPEEVGKVVAQTFSHLKRRYHDLLQEKRDGKVAGLGSDDAMIQSKYAERQSGGPK